MARAQPAVRGIGMKPTDSAAPASRLRRLVVPALPGTIVTVAGLALATGVLINLGKGDALFPGGSIGWSLALLTGIIVGHLVALGRDRWWGGTGSGAALALAVLLLFGWVPAALVSLSVVVLVGAARRHRWRQAVVHGAVDVLGIGSAALGLAAFGVASSVRHPWSPPAWNLSVLPEVVVTAASYLAVSRGLLWLSLTPRTGQLPPSPGRPSYGRHSSAPHCSASPR